MEWTELNTSGQVLTPRAGHATIAIGKHLFVFGGFTDERKLYDDLHMLNLGFVVVFNQYIIELRVMCYAYPIRLEYLPLM